jgi:hypothetical protein
MKYLIIIITMLFLSVACGVASLSFAMDYYLHSKTVDCAFSVVSGMLCMCAFIVALSSFDVLVFGGVGK